jgi:hypothetical protein
MIVVAFAVAVGVMLLWKGGGTAQPSPGAAALKPGAGTAQQESAATTTAGPPPTALPPAQLPVLVANGSGQTGLAKERGTQLKATYAQTTWGDANNTPTTFVYFVPGSEGDAQAVAAAMGFEASRVSAMPNPVPLKNPASLKANKVLVVLGADAISPTATQGAPGGPTTTAAH